MLQVALNLMCEDGRFAGELITPVGKITVLSGALRGTKLFLKGNPRKWEDYKAGRDAVLDWVENF